MRCSLGILLSILLAGCTNTGPPPVTVDMARSSSAPTAFTQLQHGRALFVSRCIECHTLPAVDRYSDSEWPHLVRAMAKRSSLNPAEQEAVLAYILAARSKNMDSQ